MLKEIVKAAKAPVKARILPQGEQASVQQPRMAWGGAQGGQGPQSDPGGQGRGQKVMGKSCENNKGVVFSLSSSGSSFGQVTQSL